jgi:SAM-dependent methyltransferase
MSVDAGQSPDWGRVSAEYSKFRAGPPASFYERLAKHGIGTPGQRLLDFGTGTGVLARTFAKAGARVTGVDVSPGQIDQAVRAASEEGLAVDFRVSPAEATPFPDASFEAITANQCWHFFDSAKAFAEARRLLVPGGLLAVSDFFWFARRDPIAAATEDLILKYNPKWTSYRWSGDLRGLPDGKPAARIEYEEAVPFTRGTWLGRVRTCRAIGPTLTPGEVAAFDEEHRRLMEATTPERFEILHKINVHIYRME